MHGTKVGCCGFPGAMVRYWERQKTFYRPPRPQTAERWRREAPTGEFTLKAWQLITHEPSSPTYRRAGPEFDPQRKDRFGSFRDSEEVWEAWLTTRGIAQALQARVILFQCPARFTPTCGTARDPLAARPLWGEPSYFRLHGLGGYRYRYTDEDLRSLRSKLPAGKECYVMFNNVYMEEDARRFLRLLDGGSE